MGRTNRWVVHVGYLALLTILALIWWWPLPLQLTRSVPGTPTWAFDEFTFLWNIWYFQHALLELRTSPLSATLIWHPVGIDLILYTYNFLHVGLALPLYWATANLALASNLVLLFQTIASGYATFLLALYLTRHRPWTVGRVGGAAIAGLIFAFASNRSVYAALGHYNMISTVGIPLYALYLFRTLDAPSPHAYRYALYGGVMFTLAALAESIFAVFLVFFTGIVMLTYPHATSAGRWWWKTVPRVALIGFTAAFLWSPVLIPMVREQIGQDYVLKGWGDSLKLSVDALGFFTPTALHPLWGEPWQKALRAVEEGTARFSDINTLFLGYVTVALAVAGALSAKRAARPWTWVAVVFALFSLGPVLQVNGTWQFDMDGIPVTIPMPFAVLHYLPFVKGNRVPNRNGVLVMLALAILAAYGILWLSQRLHRRTWQVGLTLLASLAVLFEHAALPLPLSNAQVPGIYRAIAAEPGAFTLLQIPLGWRNSFGVFGVERTQIQYYQSVHEKYILGGNTSRAPAFKMGYFERVPLFQAIAQVEFGVTPSPELVQQARTQAPELMRLYNVRYVLLFPPVPGRYPYADTWQRTWEFVKQVLPLAPDPIWQQDGIEVYRVRQAAYPSASVVDLGEPGTEVYLGEGWYENETIQGRSAVWAGKAGPRARLFLRADGDGPYRLVLRSLSFSYAGAPPQTLQVKVNGRPVGERQVIGPQWQDLVFPIPPGVTRDHTNVIELNFAWVARPRDVFEGQWFIGKTGVRLPVDVELTAFAEGAYMVTIDDEGHRTDVSYGRRGYNLTVLDPRTGEVLAKTGFDTFANVYEAQKMAQFIAEIPEGAIVLVATKDDAGRFLTDEAVAALGTLGSKVDLREYPGQFHVLVGVKGAAPGSAAEVVGTPSAYLRLGGYPDFRTLGIAVDSIALEPVP